MVALILGLLLLVDGGPPALVAPRTLKIENLGAAPVTLLLQRPDGAYLWGPYTLGADEVLRIGYCPCAKLTLELRSEKRGRPLRYPLVDQKALLLSEDRWSQGDPIVRREESPPACAARATCAGPAFHVSK